MTLNTINFIFYLGSKNRKTYLENIKHKKNEIRAFDIALKVKADELHGTEFLKYRQVNDQAYYQEWHEEKLAEFGISLKQDTEQVRLVPKS